MKTKFLEWMEKSALPLWQEKGICPKTGLAVEGLSRNGENARLGYLRMRSHARQCYVFAAAKKTESAEKLYAALLPLALKGGYPCRLSPEGEVLDDNIMLYDQAFCLLAFSAMHEMGEETALPNAKALLSFLNQYMAEEEGGYRESLSVPAQQRLQNPHMHLLEAFMALYRVSGEEVFLAHAEKMMSLFHKHFYLDGMVCEVFGQGWEPDSGKEEPGHSFEWVWLLHEYAGLCEGSSAPAKELFDRAWEKGRIAEGGFALETFQRPKHHRLWMQTEMLRSLSLYPKAGREMIWESFFRFYLNTETVGLWQDCYGLHGDNLTKYAPASSLYHLWTLYCQSSKESS